MRPSLIAGFIPFLLLSSTGVFAQGTLQSTAAIRTNQGFKSKSIAANDDGSASIEPLGFTINFFGKTRSSGYVNNNGNITFDSALATYTPFGLESTQREIIAPFFADVDTRNIASQLVTYGRDSVDGRAAFGANFLKVGYYNQHVDKLNSFQVVLIDRSDTGDGNFDIEFNYAGIRWETGDASGGVGGLGGTPASVGWSNGTGDPGTSFQYDGSLVPGSFLDNGPFALIHQKLNSTIPGRLLFRARGGRIIPPLTISTGCPLPNANLNNAYKYQVNGFGGGDNYRWSIVTDPGATFVPGLNLSTTGLVSGTPTSLGTTDFTLKLTAATEDGDQSVTRRCSLTVNPPTIRIASACPLPSATVGQPYLQSLNSTGGNGPYTWTIADTGVLGAPGLSLSSTGSITGVPTAEGTYSFTLQSSSSPSDGAQPAFKTCSITVNPAVLDLTSSCTLPNATSGVPYAQNLTVKGGSGPFVWTLSGNLPAGLSLSQSGRISGTPFGAQTAPFTATVTDSRGRSVSQNCSLVVNDPSFSITTACPLPKATAGRIYTQRLLASGGSEPYSWSVIGQLPPGLALSGDGLISGSPMGTGPHSFRLLASDSSGRSAATSCSLQVLPAEFFSPSCPLPLGTVGVPYSQTVNAVGGTPPYIFTTSSQLPLGITLNTYGYVSGTPYKAGTFPLSLQITDSLGGVSNQLCSINIQPSPVQILSACPLPQATVGTPYSASFGASGGTPPYTFTVEGLLPAGLTLGTDGTLSGSPTAQVDRAFDVRVADAVGNTNVIDCSVSVALPSFPGMSFSKVNDSYPPASPGPTATLTLNHSYTLPVQGTIKLGIVPDTGETTGSANQVDPHVRFANGRTVFDFTLAPGKTQVSVPITSTGTVASTITLSAANLKAGGQAIPLAPAPVSFSVPRQAPIVTAACITAATPDNGAQATITGSSTTRALTSAVFNYVTAGGSSNSVTIDLSGTAAEFFSSDDSILNGGAFTVTVPFTNPGVAVSSASMTVTNSAGTSASTTLGTCH